MSEYPIGFNVSYIAVATSAAVPIFGLIVGAVVGGLVTLLIIRGWMQ